MKRIIWLFVGLFVASFALLILGATEPFLLLVTIGFGWIPYLANVLPEVRIAWPALFTGFICMGATLLLGHVLARWFWRETQPGAEMWRARWTLGAFAIVILMFVSGIAATGVTHQTGWLLRSEERMFTRFRRSHEIHCQSTMRQLGQMIHEYADEHDGALPDSLEQLFSGNSRFAEEMSRCPAPDGGPYVYHGRGLRLPLTPEAVLITEPLVYHRGRSVNVLVGDLSTRRIPPQEAEATISRGLAARGGRG